MPRCVHCRKETTSVTLIEGIGRIAVCEECMAANDVDIDVERIQTQTRVPAPATKAPRSPLPR